MAAQRIIQSTLRLTEVQEADWIALASRWGMSKNATVHRAISEALALEEYDAEITAARDGAVPPLSQPAAGVRHGA